MATAKQVDFSSVKDGGTFNRSRIPAGDYLATVTKVTDEKSNADGSFQYLFSIKINSRSQSVFPYYCKLQENQLWKLRNLLIAAGLTVPKKKVKVDPNRVVSRQIGVTIEDDEYEGKEQSQIMGVFPAAELSDGHLVVEADSDDDDVAEDDNWAQTQIDDEPADDADEDEEEAEDEASQFAGMSRSELKVEIKKLLPEFVVKKSMSDDDLRDSLTDAVADQAGSDDEEEEEEEAPAPVKTKAVKAAPAKKVRKKATPVEVTDDELEELDIDDI